MRALYVYRSHSHALMQMHDFARATGAKVMLAHMEVECRNGDRVRFAVVRNSEEARRFVGQRFDDVQFFGANPDDSLLLLKRSQ